MPTCVILMVESDSDFAFIITTAVSVLFVLFVLTPDLCSPLISVIHPSIYLSRIAYLFFICAQCFYRITRLSFYRTALLYVIKVVAIKVFPGNLTQMPTQMGRI